MLLGPTMAESSFDFKDGSLLGLTIIRRKLLGDHRGSFSRLFCSEAFLEAGFAPPVSQINHTRTRARGTIRGLHFQHPPHAEIKVVTCLRGEVYDIAVDLRKGSPTFLAWQGIVLSEANQTTLVIPQGFAHGFQTLTDDCEMIYLHSAAHHPEAEGGLHPEDPRLGIPWPCKIGEMSQRDQAWGFVPPHFQGISL
jgi:dTDP-4-dehydrorhamnose 3,5-epimerase